MEIGVSEERGSSMVEMLGVISVMAILATGAWNLIGSARYRYRVSQGIMQLQSLQKGINRFYASAGNYNKLADNDAIKVLFENRIIPKEMKASGNKIRNIFRNEVEIKNVPYENIEDYGKSSDSFTITFKAVEKKECMELASIAWVQNDSANLVSIQIGETKFVWPKYDSGEGDVLPVTTAKGMVSCADAPVDMSWEFR